MEIDEEWVESADVVSHTLPSHTKLPSQLCWAVSRVRSGPTYHTQADVLLDPRLTGAGVVPDQVDGLVHGGLVQVRAQACGEQETQGHALQDKCNGPIVHAK